MGLGAVQGRSWNCPGVRVSAGRGGSGEGVRKQEPIALRSAKERSQAPVGDPTLVLAGQGGNRWAAPRGSRTVPLLTCSSQASFMGRCPVLRGLALGFMLCHHQLKILTNF